MYVVRREGNVLTRVCPSVCPHPGGGGTPARYRWGGKRGNPSQVQSGGGNPIGGTQLGEVYPTSGTLRWTWPGGYPTSGTPPPPCWTWLGGPLLGVPPPQVPPIRPGWGYPCWGALLWYPPPQGGGYPDGVLDTPRSVCLLRSRRRTFLWLILFVMNF